MTKSVIGHTAGILALAAAVNSPGVSAGAGQRAADQEWCANERFGGDRAGVCEVRQFEVPATGGTLSVRATNGGISVEGESRGNVHILAKVVATASSEARARQIADAVRLNPTSDEVHAEGPRNLQNGDGWTVSYRLSVPTMQNLSIRTTNGGIAIRGVESSIAFETTNGGVTLARLAGDVKGRTTNGGVSVELEGATWVGDGLDVETTNGGVRIAVPEQYSARLDASTSNGGFQIDHPGAVRSQQQERRPRNLSVQLGSGGPPIRVRTTNGGVRLVRK